MLWVENKGILGEGLIALVGNVDSIGVSGKRGVVRTNLLKFPTL